MLITLFAEKAHSTSLIHRHLSVFLLIARQELWLDMIYITSTKSMYLLLPQSRIIMKSHRNWLDVLSTPSYTQINSRSILVVAKSKAIQEIWQTRVLIIREQTPSTLPWQICHLSFRFTGLKMFWETEDLVHRKWPHLASWRGRIRTPRRRTITTESSRRGTQTARWWLMLSTWAYYHMVFHRE